MLSRILVPLDGSPFAEWALPMAVAIARRTGGAIRLVSVVDRRAPDLDRDRMHEYLDAAMRRILLLCPGTIDLVVREGRPVDELDAEIADWGPDVVVMSTHGRAGLARIWKGSVAAGLVERARRPVLLVRPPDLGAADPDQAPCVARVVVPLDGSEQAERAMEQAAVLARAFGVHILLLNVQDRRGDAVAKVELDPAETDDPTRAAALAYLKAEVARLRVSGLHSYGMLLNEPEAAETIADRVRGDLLVMATQGHDRFHRTMLGTVTDKVVRDASCAVMVIPPLYSEAAREAKSA
jgi:nucleotide-binding universal stress UspA family protein